MGSVAGAAALQPSSGTHQMAPDASPSDDASMLELPDALIRFVTQSHAACEPPRKRQKIMTEKGGVEADGVVGRGLGSKEQELDHIVVKESTWVVECAGSKLSKLETPLGRDNVKVFVTGRYQPEAVNVMDDAKNTIFAAQLPENKEGLEDVLIALAVHKEWNKWAKGEGRYWTDVGVILSQRYGKDVVQLVFTVKWNITTSPYNVAHVNKKTPVLANLLKSYFQDPFVSNSDTWSPQDFYQSVHSPNKKDEISASIQTPEIESILFPFQKRAVQWLLRKEGVEWSGRQVQVVPDTVPEDLPNSFVKTKDAHGRSCYVSHLFGLVTLDVAPFVAVERVLKGGILAEEMGLGKTVEMISLITLHKRAAATLPTVLDPFIGEHVRPISASLIVTPPSILQQWISEVNRHAPQLKVTHYQGIKGHGKKNLSELVNRLAESDVVVTTYSVLAAEINFTALNPEKSLRTESKYPRPKSPLMQLSWWRVIMDEAQMIESGVSKAAVVARMIPRINAWCVTGTPVRKDVNDLLGLLIFLRFEPFASTKHIWQSLITLNKHEFRKLFGWLALRHSKQSVRDELKLPAQRRYVITMPFTPIEEQHYQELFKQMCAESGLDVEGAPLSDAWDPDTHAETMRRWLVRLRQSALHPEVGGRNRRALGSKDGPLRTVDQVLDAMMENTDVAIRTDQRTLLTSKLKRGQLDENSPRVKEALAIWEEVAKEASVIVEESREQLRQEIAKVGGIGKVYSSGSRDISSYDSDSSDSQEDNEISSRLGVFRNRLRGALEIEHMAVFFRTNAYFQLKTNEEMTKPKSREFNELETLETEGYEMAKKMRQEILLEIFRKADRLMRSIRKKADTQSFVNIPEFPTDPPRGGLESRRILEQLDTLAAALDAQANTFDEWREQTIQFLLRPLVDEDGEFELTGDEYEESTKTQDEVMVYVQALRAAIADRHDALTGLENLLIKNDVKLALKLAKDGDGAFPEKTIELLNTRLQIKPTKEMGSLRGIVANLRGLATSLKPDAEGGSLRAQSELALVESKLGTIQKQFSEQIKATAALEKEIEFFRSAMNARLEYYRQLQQVSDTVAPYEGEVNDAVRAKMLENEAQLAKKVATAKSKRRYLDHLRMEAANPQEQRICVICRDAFEVGALTVCGHQYCRECIGLWWHSHHNCPICKRRLIPADLHQITYKPQQLSIQAEEIQDASQERASHSSASRKSAIYSEISKSKLAEIKNIELDGPSFTTKIDTLARHLIWLRESDPGAKSIIYSQFKDFLEVLARAFERFRIGFSSIDKPNGIEKFKQDPGIECFLLHSRAHSSGLNLVNASHVFLCEPLLNTALELQAIARVDRIGQHQETNVWLYLVDGTVEESIYDLSVKRRMEHIGQTISSKKRKNGKGKAKETTVDELLDTNLEEANSMELQHASLAGLLAKGGKGGEMVEKEDLWDCLFGGVGVRSQERKRAIGNHRARFDEVVRRHLGAEAAEERMAIVET
ncbi:putative ATP-dependent helicase [Hyphodiscus hymeniophilus]|uniref:ATP-dependent helicase n=1 Tax=Hyphodiscus hymeniophilus TaxID=353542 RepID=A0A9P6SQ49_9HELO|nr:putative ATP-dependent helicase [Hyphodiscus hymeniophilus]